MELISFLKLYAVNNNAMQSLFILLISLYLNAAFYILDLYGLVKKKTQGETAAVMLLPASLAVMGSAMLSLLVSIPTDNKRLDRFVEPLDSAALSGEFLMAAVLYAAAWALAWSPKELHRSRRAFCRWVISCIPDFIFAVIVMIPAVIRLALGTNPFRATRGLSVGAGFNFDVFLWIFLYALMMLLCKIILLLTGSFARLITKRLPHTWHEGRSPALYVAWHMLVCQNALLRGALAFYIAMFGLLTGTLIWSGELSLRQSGGAELIGILVFLYISGVFVIMVIIRKPISSILRFEQWGDPKKLKECFCREYCTMEPVIAGEDFTVTRHFLIDEQRPAGLYYWNELESCSNWMHDGKSGWKLRLYFRDGQVCVLDKEDMSAELIAGFARQWQTGRFDGAKTRQQDTRKPKALKAYENVIARFACAFVILLVFLGNGGQFLSGEWNKSLTSSKDDAAPLKKQVQTVSAGKDGEFPIMVAYNSRFKIYATSCSRVVTGQDIIENEGRVQVEKREASRVVIAVCGLDGKLLQELEHTSPVLDTGTTLLSGRTDYKYEFARLTDADYDGDDDLLLCYDNTEGLSFSIYLWDEKKNKFILASQNID